MGRGVDWAVQDVAQLAPVARGGPKTTRNAIETAVNETPQQTLSVLRQHSSLDMSRSTLWRALHEDLHAR